MNKKREPAHPTLPHPPRVGKDTKNKSTPTSGRKGGRIKTNNVTMPYILNSSSSKHTRVALI